MDNYMERFVAGHGINFGTSIKNNEAFIKSREKWAEISADLNIDQNEHAVMLFCGAKNNGKSSLVRHLINEYNQKDANRFVYLIDFDPGQPEITTPGMVSAHIVRSNDPHPLSSPTYLNLNQHECLLKSSVGGLNMSVNPRLYLTNCKFVLKKVIEHSRNQKEKHPIFINTMGFIRGIGLAILLDLIKLCSPTHLIVLDIETDPMRTICTDLTPQVVDETRVSFIDTRRFRLKRLTYQFLKYNLPFTFTDSSTTATKNRVALQVAYMGSIPEALYMPIMQLKPKHLDLKSTFIHCVSSFPLKPNIVLEIINQSWIHLVKLSKKQSYNWLCSENGRVENGIVENGCNGEIIGENNENDGNNLCLMAHNVDENVMIGCGIVVDIEVESGKISIITPLDQRALEQVNCIMKPLSMQVPQVIANDSLAPK